MGDVYGGRYVSTGQEFFGGSGSVIICRDPNLERPVAIKFLQPYVDKLQIQQEFAALQRIRSKHVVDVYDIVIFQPGNHVGIVQEYIPGSDLSAILTQPPPTPDAYLAFLFQIVSGLADIHQQGLVHRDIKPNNMKLCAEGIVKIFDFGLARKSRSSLTQSLKGTFGFIAPELWDSFANEASAETDIYAFAVTAACLAEGEIPNALVSSPLRKPYPGAWIAGGGFSKMRVSLPPLVASALNLAISPIPALRPTAICLRDLIANQLLVRRHRAQFIHNGVSMTCDSSLPTVRIGHASSNLEVRYDGYQFSVVSVTGGVYINNKLASAGSALDGSCVITIPAADGRTRDFVTMDVSRPEVVL